PFSFLHLSQLAWVLEEALGEGTTGVSPPTAELMVNKNSPIEFNNCLFMLFALTKVNNKSVIHKIIRLVRKVKKNINHKNFK
ncbi:MAG: hypothetical protein NTV50_10600, partial [Planctomycetota bacterium]|nr:hypothetical protein [Planctomycetota bacterium]